MMNDTIAAIITPFGVGAIAVIRVSGNDAISKVNQIFKGKDLTKVNSHTIHYGHLVKGDHLIDEVVVSIFHAPRSFTCENTVEISCHGGIYTTKQVLSLILQTGVRMAENGEFSKRAFLNGRLDLSQAESIMDIINANNSENLQIAQLGLQGKFLALVKKLRQKLEMLMLKIEVNIDYPEYEDEIQMTDQLIHADLKIILEEINLILDKSKTGQVIACGIQTAIIGRPNVGKSSILNMLLEMDKAIVTAEAGTTRDIVEGVLNIGGLNLRIIDTAGIRNTSSKAEQLGIEKAYQILEQADLVLLVLDASNELTDIDYQLLEKTACRPRIIIANKSDLVQKTRIKDAIVNLSTITLEGKAELIDTIKEMFNIHQFNQERDNYLTNIRHINLLEQAKQALLEAQKQVLQDIIEIDLKNAYDYLGEIIGVNVSDELISALFANFCLGK